MGELKRLPYRIVRFEGVNILIGRTAEENDLLTLEIAQPNDIWLHVGEALTGSHVVIQNPNDIGIPKQILIRAAELAAWYSKARNRKIVKVHYCKASDVNKSKGFAAGSVQIKKWRELKVTPSGP